MSETNSTKKRKQTTNNSHPKENLGSLQKNNKKEIWKCVLYMRGKRIDLIKLAHRASVSKSFTWSISKIRPENSASTMLLLQYKFRGKWGDVYRKYEEIGGRKVRTNDNSRPQTKCKGIRLVRAIITKI